MDKLTLFKITEEQEVLNLLLEESGGEITPEIEQRLAINHDNFLTKAENYAYTIKNDEAMIDAFANAIKNLQARKKVIENRVQRLKGMLDWAMTTFEIDKINVGLNTLSYRSSQQVIVEDLEKLDPKYIILTKSADKASLKESLKAGEEVAGAKLITNKNLQIK